MIPQLNFVNKLSYRDFCHLAQSYSCQGLARFQRGLNELAFAKLSNKSRNVIVMTLAMMVELLKFKTQPS